jgi:hypothetical protein
LTTIDRSLFFAGSILILPGSSVVEQVTVNHLVAGSNPARAAMPPFFLTRPIPTGFCFLEPRHAVSLFI